MQETLWPDRDRLLQFQGLANQIIHGDVDTCSNDDVLTLNSGLLCVRTVERINLVQYSGTRTYPICNLWEQWMRLACTTLSCCQLCKIGQGQHMLACFKPYSWLMLWSEDLWSMYYFLWQGSCPVRYGFEDWVGDWLL